MASRRFVPRQLMEQAVEVMAASTQEPRGDGKASPLVGAVLWNDGEVDTVTTAAYQKALEVPARTARSHIKRFVDLGRLRAQGAARARRYAVLLP